MRRHLPALVVVLALLAGCAPAEGFEPTSPPAPSAVARVLSPSPNPNPTPRATPVARATPTPAPTETPLPEPTASPEPKPYAINLATTADFVPQYTFDWCVGPAS